MTEGPAHGPSAAGPGPGHGHGHGHAHDRGVSAMVRYLRWAPWMWRSAVNAAVIDLVDPVAGERLVDIGAGMGPGTVRAAQRGAIVVAVEPTPFMRRVLTARRLLQRARDRITVLDGAAEHLPLPDHTADAVVAVNTMHHWVDARRGATEIARVLRPGGRMVLVDEDFEDPEHPDVERFGSRHDDEHHGFTPVDATEMGELVTAAGLVGVDASRRRLADRPVIAITGHAPADWDDSRPGGGPPGPRRGP